ncbi:MAG TPA: hypothetical protein VNA25_25550, partial [Phycisphaerae bacterium]|nr:hypothetical protein [Phycisphaerae bacterium]
PRPTNLVYDEVVVPISSANLQAPSPSNPGGAAHVTLVRPISIDEIKRMAGDFFDLIDEKKAKEMELLTESRDQKDTQQQKRTMQGQEQPSGEIDKTHGNLTLLTCFDIFDISDTGKNEDVIWWVIEESKTLLRGRRMTEMFPFAKPRRPFAEASFIPTPGFREGIGVPELIEGMHDLRKETLDLAVDAGTFEAFQFFFYRQASNMNPEIMRVNPGEGYPLTDPQRDVVFPNAGNNNSHAFAFNLMSMANAEQEKLTLVGEIQQGRVPAGRSSALRTSGGIAQLMEAGAARPERILRRFFMMLTDVYRMMYELNREFLDGEKKVRLLSPDKSGKDVFAGIRRDDLEGVVDFDFVANQGNSSREAMKQSLTDMMTVYMTPLAIEMGVVTPENVYQMLNDFGKANGPPVDRYLTQPGPESGEVRITAQAAISQIVNNQFPKGIPMEPTQEHMATLQQFSQGPDMAYLSSPQVAGLQEYMQQVGLRLKKEEEQRRQQAAAAKTQGGTGQGVPGPEAGPVQPKQQQLQENEIADETLPSERGDA